MTRYEKIKTLCKERGITITGLERELGFARGSLSKIDKNQPSADRLEKLSSYFGLPVDYFLEVQTFGQQTATESAGENKNLSATLPKAGIYKTV